jgi:hypothetical protein
MPGMLTPRDITLPGFYWYFDPIGAPPTVVEIARRDPPRPGGGWPGREDEDALLDLAGTFVGPLQAPLA